MGNEEQGSLSYVEEDIVTLTLDNDEEMECAIVAIFPVEKEEYIALTPVEEEEDGEERSLFFYRFREIENADPELLNIEDEEEYQMAFDTFVELFGIDEAD